MSRKKIVIHNKLRLGKNQLRALRFINKCSGWHSYDRSVKQVIHILAKKKLVDFVWYEYDGQFKITKRGRQYLWDNALH